MIKTIAGRYWTGGSTKGPNRKPVEKDMSKTKLTPLDPPELAGSAMTRGASMIETNSVLLLDPELEMEPNRTW
jgi:hypothetical protein